MVMQTNPVSSTILKPLSFTVLAVILWQLRSWNLDIGDGLFCCKQTIGDQIFVTTLSRSFLSYLLYRAMFFSLSPILGLWVEDIIALSSCAAGLLFFWALNRLSEESSRNPFERWVILLFPSTTLILQIFCGHIEFYSWTNAFLMLCVYWSWKCIHHKQSPLYASAALALAAGFHSSGVFYFPALLLLPWLQAQRDNQIGLPKPERIHAVLFFFLFMITIMLHRYPSLYLIVLLPSIPLYFLFVNYERRVSLNPWMLIYLPWMVLFTIRASLNMKAEPLIEHLPPFMEPYDHGAYLYMAFSWEHLYDKTMFHLWLAPFGLITIIGFCFWKWSSLCHNRWTVFLGNFCVWTMVWTVLFYPQLRTRDWDLFATMSIPFNLMALYLILRYTSTFWQRLILPLAILIHLYISIPILISNSHLLEGRGYASVQLESQPVSADVYIRSLKMGFTPLAHQYIRTGMVDVRMIPHERDYLSWSQEVELMPGEMYRFSAQFEPR